MAIPILLAAHLASKMLDYVKALHVHSSGCGILKALWALGAVVWLVRVMFTTDVLQQQILLFKTLFGFVAIFTRITNVQFVEIGWN